MSDHPHRAAFEEAVNRHRGELRGFLAGRIPAADVEDVLQAALLRAAERLDGLRDTQAIRAWLFRIVRNASADYGRRRRPAPDSIEGLPDPTSAGAPEVSACQCALGMVRSLPAGQAAVFEAVVLGEATTAEAATALGISRGNADVRLHRARKGLRDRLADHCGVSTLAEAHSCSCNDSGCEVAWTA